MPNCPTCGARNPRENTVCRSCGSVLLVDQPTVEVPPTVAELEKAPEELFEPGEESAVETLEGEEPVEGAEQLVQCVRCKNQVDPREAYVVPGRGRGGQLILCDNCAHELENQIKAETEDANLGRGALFGLGAAVVCGAIWYLVEHYTGFPLVVMSFIGGWLIAEAVRYGAGKKRGRPLQFIALGLTALLILGARYALIGQTDPAAFLQAFGAELQETFTLILYALALWQAYSTPAVRRILWTRREPEEAEDDTAAS